MLWGIDLADASGWTVATALGLMILLLVVTGRFVPRRYYRDIIEERNSWRNASLAKDETLAELSAQLREARVVVRANAAFLQALPRGDQGASDEVH